MGKISPTKKGTWGDVINFNLYPLGSEKCGESMAKKKGAGGGSGQHTAPRKALSNTMQVTSFNAIR